MRYKLLIKLYVNHIIGVAIAAFGLTLCATCNLFAHAPDDQYQAEYDRRLPQGDDHLLSAVIEALNRRDFGFFNFFGPYISGSEADEAQAALADIWKADLRFSEVTGTESIKRDDHSPLVQESIVVDEIKAHRVVGTFRLIITWKNPDGFLNILSIQLNP